MTTASTVEGRGAGERGIALVLSLFLMLAMSVIGASLMFLSQSEAYASMNYRLMSQARYGAESGIHKASNFLMDTTAYPGPQTASATDPIEDYTMTATSVTYNAADVVLSSLSTTPSNYPVGAVQTAFATASAGSLSAGTTPISYAVAAKLLSMRQITVYGQAALATVQTWLITSQGSIAGGARTAQVEVSAVLERQVVPAFSYAAFGTYSGCDALAFSGGGSTDSYDSSAALVGGVPATAAYGGNIGTNGNLTEAGQTTTVSGTLYTPRVGVGACSESNPTAWTQNGNATVSGGVATLPQPVAFATPDAPPGVPTTDMNLSSGGCGSTSYGAPDCTEIAGDVTLTPSGGGTMTLGNISLNNNILYLSPGTYNLNSITFTGTAKIQVVGTGNVILNVAGLDADGGYLTTPIFFAGQSATNSSFDPARLQITYAGTGTIKVAGGTDAAALIYAPNASVNLTGGSNWYGSIIAKTIDNSGGSAIHYDRRLQTSQLSLGAYMMSAFTWKKY